MKNDFYTTRENYIKALNYVLSAKENFKGLKYCRDSQTNEEYLIMSNVIGEAFVFDVTGITDAEMYHSIAVIEAGKVPSNFITDRKKLIDIGKRFNK